MKSNFRFPGETDDYRNARNELLESEAELRRQVESVAAKGLRSSETCCLIGGGDEDEKEKDHLRWAGHERLKSSHRFSLNPVSQAPAVRRLGNRVGKQNRSRPPTRG